VNNLPPQVTPFVGREHEVAELKRLLRTRRLLTLVGPDGIGKTRLSLEIAAEVVDDYLHGVWFVELAPVSDPELVAQAVASVLGVKEEAGSPVVDALVRYVADRQLLLILDNCEHVAQACANLVKQLLQSGPHLKILASGREQLGLAGEMSYSVPALAAPEATRLFIDRAVLVQPDFQVTRETAAAVADICRRLDGIPLAIELAAARVRSLSVEAIAERLTNRFRELTGGSRTHLPRQQTLRALIDWSYNLLSEAGSGLRLRSKAYRWRASPRPSSKCTSVTMRDSAC